MRSGQKKAFWWFLLLLLILNLGFRLYSYRSRYLTPFDSNYWRERYLRSQWVVPDSQEPIGDDGLYAYAGWEYIHGRDPTTLNPEIPPLGKYLIGLSILVFNNQNIFAFWVGVLVLFAFFKLNQLIFKNNFWSLLPVVLFSFEPLFWQQLRAPFLDLLYLLFLFLVFIFFLQKRFLLTAVALGLMMATKASVATLILVAFTTFSYLFLKQDWQRLKKWIFNLPVAFLTFLLVYFRYFWLGHGLLSFLKVQRWILSFYFQGARGVLGAVWRLLLTGEWLTWWQGMKRVEEWQLSWPVLLLVNFPFWWQFLQKRRQKISLLVLWNGFYLLFLSFIPVWPRYLLLFLPFSYNFLVWSFYHFKEKII